MRAPQQAVRNRILLAAPEAERNRMLAAAKLVQLPRGQTLYHPGDPVLRIYFINRGLISLVQEMHDGIAVDVGARGIEGLTTPEALLDSPRAIFTNMVQIPCEAWSVDLQTVRRCLETSNEVRNLISGYFHVATQQLGQTTACNRLHSLEQRLCRWLLIAHDGAGADEFPLTHEFLALMVAAPRSGVSQAAHKLRENGYIEYRHGDVHIRNRDGLESQACECYRTIQDEFDKLFNGTSAG